MDIEDKRKKIKEHYEDHDVVILTDADGNETLAMIFCAKAKEGNLYLLGFLSDTNKDFGLDIGGDNPNELIDNVITDLSNSFIKAEKVNAKLVITD